MTKREIQEYIEERYQGDTSAFYKDHPKMDIKGVKSAAKKYREGTKRVHTPRVSPNVTAEQKAKLAKMTKTYEQMGITPTSENIDSRAQWESLSTQEQDTILRARFDQPSSPNPQINAHGNQEINKYKLGVQSVKKYKKGTDKVKAIDPEDQMRLDFLAKNPTKEKIHKAEEFKDFPEKEKSYLDRVIDWGTKKEHEISKSLGFPSENADRIGMMEDENADPIRHANAGRLTAEAIAKKTGSKWAGVAGSNILGLGHEAVNFPWDRGEGIGWDLKESAQDMYNNFKGSMISLDDSSEDDKQRKIRQLAKKGGLKKGVVELEDRFDMSDTGKAKDWKAKPAYAYGSQNLIGSQEQFNPMYEQFGGAVDPRGNDTINPNVGKGPVFNKVGGADYLEADGGTYNREFETDANKMYTHKAKRWQPIDVDLVPDNNLKRNDNLHRTTKTNRKGEQLHKLKKDRGVGGGGFGGGGGIIPGLSISMLPGLSLESGTQGISKYGNGSQEMNLMGNNKDQSWLNGDALRNPAAAQGQPYMSGEVYDVTGSGNFGNKYDMFRDNGNVENIDAQDTKFNTKPPTEKTPMGSAGGGAPIIRRPKFGNYEGGSQSIRSYAGGSQEVDYGEGEFGYQKMEVPPAGGAANVLSNTAAGAQLGANFGPWGAAAGAAAGVTKGLLENRNTQRQIGNIKDHNQSLKEFKRDDQEYQVMQAENGLDMNKYEQGTGYLGAGRFGSLEDPEYPRYNFGAQALSALPQAMDFFGVDKEISKPINDIVNTGVSAAAGGAMPQIPGGMNPGEMGNQLQSGGGALPAIPQDPNLTQQMRQNPDMTQQLIMPGQTASMQEKGNYSIAGRRHKPIEAEGAGIGKKGGELIFRRKKNGTFLLKKDLNGQPSHDEGGVNIMAEEGDVIYPNKMRKKALEAYKNNDNLTLEDLRSKLPKDTDPNNQAEDGLNNPYVQSNGTLGGQMQPSASELKGIRDAYGIDYEQKIIDTEGDVSKLDKYDVPTLTANRRAKFDKGDYSPYTIGRKEMTPMPQDPRLTQELRDNPDDTELITGEPEGSSGGYPARREHGWAKARMHGAPLYNFAQGLFGNPEVSARRFIDPEQLKYTDMSAEDRAAAQRGSAAAKKQGRDFYMSRGQREGRNAQIGSRYLDAQGKINQNEARRFDQVNQYNVGTRNQAQGQNVGLANQYDDIDAQNRAAKQRMLAKGFEQEGEIAGFDRQENFMRDREDRLYDTDMKKLNIEAFKHGVKGEDLERIMGGDGYGGSGGRGRNRSGRRGGYFGGTGGTGGGKFPIGGGRGSGAGGRKTKGGKTTPSTPTKSTTPTTNKQVAQTAEDKRLKKLGNKAARKGNRLINKDKRYDKAVDKRQEKQTTEYWDKKNKKADEKKAKQTMKENSYKQHQKDQKKSDKEHERSISADAKKEASKARTEKRLDRKPLSERNRFKPYDYKKTASQRKTEKTYQGRLKDETKSKIDIYNIEKYGTSNKIKVALKKKTERRKAIKASKSK